jgi:hypothetical protein
MALIRAQVILPYFTNIPEDVATNTLYFLTTGVPATGPELAEINDRIIDAYGVIDQALASFVSRVGNSAQIKLYDMADPLPRAPIDTTNFALAAAAESLSMPGEVSVVMSYHASYESGVPNARRRGRIYLGPLGRTPIGGGSGSAFPSVAGAFIVLVGAMFDILIRNTGDVIWAQYSPTAGEPQAVVGGWVDDAIDTQRRRGNAPTTRTLLPTDPG